MTAQSGGNRWKSFALCRCCKASSKAFTKLTSFKTLTRRVVRIPGMCDRSGSQEPQPGETVALVRVSGR